MLSFLYFIINIELNPFWSLEEKYKELYKQAENFSYRNKVMKTRKKISENCTDEIEDLFKKMFSAKVEKRITFSEIRQHPVFLKHFPQASEESKILYMTKFKSSRLKKEVKNTLKDKVGKLQKKDSLGTSWISAIDEEGDFTKEKEIVKSEYEEIRFLWCMVEDINLY